MRTVGVFTDGHGRAALAAFSGLTCAAGWAVHAVSTPVRPGAEHSGSGRALVRCRSERYVPAAGRGTGS